MDAKTVFTFAGGLVAGLVIGALLFSAPAPTGTVTQTNAQAPQGQSGVDKLRLQQEITRLEALVKDDPSNYGAWKKLGDNYFDVDNAKKSVSAYKKALDLEGNDPNVWTDMGVMYRRLQQFDKALESFDRAIKENPNHTVSRLNRGVVYIYDLKEIDKGIAAWEEFLRIEPQGQQADRIRQELATVKSMQAVQSGDSTLPPDHPDVSSGAAPAPQAGSGSTPETYFPKPAAQ